MFRPLLAVRREDSADEAIANGRKLPHDVLPSPMRCTKRWVKREVENTVCEAATRQSLLMEAATRALRATQGPAQGRNPQPTHAARTGREQGPRTHPDARENEATRVRPGFDQGYQGLTRV